MLLQQFCQSKVAQHLLKTTITTTAVIALGAAGSFGVIGSLYAQQVTHFQHQPASATAPSNSAAAVDSVKAIFVGHSLINHQMPDMVRQLAVSSQNQTLTMDKVVQVFNGSPLKYNWQNCHQADFTGEWPPQAFACDELAASSGFYDSLIVTEANNPISGHHYWNETQVYLEQFTEALKTHNSAGKAYFFTSWEGLNYHSGEWTDAIAAELVEYEQIVAEAEQLSAARGRHADIKLIPTNLALRELILKIERGEMTGLSNRLEIFQDDVHMNKLGNYYIANVVFAAIYGRSPVGLTQRMLDEWGNIDIDIEPTLATQLQTLAWQIVTDYQLSKSQPGGDNIAPSGDIVYPNGDLHLDVGHSLSFVASGSDINGDTLNYLWDFGTFTQPQTSQTTNEIRFDQPGEYTITLIVTDAQGLSDPSPDSVKIIVRDPQQPNLSPQSTIVSPNPTMTQVIKVGQSLAFSGEGNDPEDGNNVSYLWDFAGAAPAVNSSTTDLINFAQVGQYTITLTVTDSQGLADPTPAQLQLVVEALTPVEYINGFVPLPVTADGHSNLSWQAPSVVNQIDHYNINVNGQHQAMALSTAINFTVSGLNPFRVNQLGITAVNSDGDVIAESPVIELTPVVTNTAGTPNQQSAIGMNLTGLSYWSSQWTLLDVMRHASNGSGQLWATGSDHSYNSGHQSRLDLDANGWPKSLPSANDPDFTHVSTVIYQDNQDYPVGDYVVLYEGEGQLRYNGGQVIAELSSPGRDVVRLAANSYLHLQISATDPNKTGNYIRNVRVIVPGGICGNNPLDYAENASQCSNASDFNTFEQIHRYQTFHPLFLKDIAKYRALRFMQMLSTNVTNQRVWSDRPTSGYASWGLNDGIPYEVALDLANTVQAEPWLNVPARVDDDYIRQYAQLVKANLAPNLKFHVELGNEIWNNAYPYVLDAHWMEEQGRATWPDAGADPFMYRLNYYGMRVSQMCEIFKAEFADQADRVQCVMASQGGNAWVGEQMLACSLYAPQNGGQNCARNIDSMAIGPYFAGYLADARYVPILAQWANEGQAGLDKLFTEINSGILREMTDDPTQPDWMQAPHGGALAQAKRFMVENKAIADQFGVKLTVYEGGQHLTYTGDLSGDRALINQNIFLAGNRDSRMGQAFTQYLNDWQTVGGQLFTVFESTGRWGSFGAFPVKEYQLQPLAETPKLADILAFIDGNPCWWDNCLRETYRNSTVAVDPLPEPPALGEVVLTSSVRLDSWGVSLNWTAINGPVRYYQVFRDGEFIGHTDSNVTSYNNDWLQLHQQYQFQIKAVTETMVVLAESNLISTLAGDSVAPTAPSQLTAVFDGQYGFNLSWHAATDDGGVARYLIYRNGQPFTSTTATTFADEWPPAGVVRYQVFAQDNVNNTSVGSAIINAAVPSLALTISATTRPESWGVALNWQFSHEDILYFQIFRDGQFIGHTDATGSSFNADWLQLHTDYQFQVRAVNANGEVLFLSNTLVSQAGDSEAPSQPTGVTVTFNGSYGFNVSWDAATDNTGVAYYIIIRNGQAFTTRTGVVLADDWPPQSEMSYQIIAVDHYHNESTPSIVVVGNTQP